MFGKGQFCIWDVDLTNVVHDSHGQIDIFLHICRSQFRDMNDTIPFCNVVVYFYYSHLLSLFEGVLSNVANSNEQQDRQRLWNRLSVKMSEIKH